MSQTVENIGIVGTSAVMQEVVERLRQVAPTDLCVLITGESGTGKEVFAKAIHQLSKRRRERLVSLNCGAIPETLLESELFGSEKGAYTGASEQRKGFFEAADKGTIFLDELGEMPLGTQVKLLRVLETGEFSRLGSPDVIRTDVRVIAATNRRLEEEVAAGRFRTDLFYRLNTVRIEIPPLRNHAEDIPELVEFFALRTAGKNGTSYQGITPDALDLLVNLPWAGNIRELRNLIETIITLEKGHQITIEALRPYLPRALKEAEISVNEMPSAQVMTAFPKDFYPALPPSDATFRLPEFAESILQANMRANLTNDFSGTAITPKKLLSSALPQLLPKTPEQLERELMYKALVDLAREVALLRQEMTDLKDAVILQKPENESLAVGSEIHSAKKSDELLAPAEGDDAFFPLTMNEVEKRLIGAALSRFDGNRRLTADALGISERTLYRKLREYGMISGNEIPDKP